MLGFLSEERLWAHDYQVFILNGSVAAVCGCGSTRGASAPGQNRKKLGCISQVAKPEYKLLTLHHKPEVSFSAKVSLLKGMVGFPSGVLLIKY